MTICRDPHNPQPRLPLTASKGLIFTVEFTLSPRNFHNASIQRSPQTAQQKNPMIDTTAPTTISQKITPPSTTKRMKAKTKPLSTRKHKRTTSISLPNLSKKTSTRYNPLRPPRQLCQVSPGLAFHITSRRRHLTTNRQPALSRQARYNVSQRKNPGTP